MTIVTTFMSEKLRQRIHNHGSQLESLYDVVPMECLPDEYLPDDYEGPRVGSMQECVEQHVQRMTQPHVRARIKVGQRSRSLGVM